MLHTHERPTSRFLLAVGLELESLSLLPAQRPPQTLIRVPFVRMGIDDIVWDVNGIKHQYTGKRGVPKAGFSIATIEKGADRLRWPAISQGLKFLPRRQEARRRRNFLYGFFSGVLSDSVVKRPPQFFHPPHRNSEFDF